MQDHLGRKLEVPDFPKRIISLCPSLTETLIVLGIDERLVGRTNFCIHPADKLWSVPKIGGTKQVRYDAISELKPDLIIAEKEENTPEIVAMLSEKYPVFVTEVKGFDSAIRMIGDLGTLCDASQFADQLIAEIMLSFEKIMPANKRVKTAYFIWKDPYMVVGSGTYIHDMLERCGFDNVFASRMDSRYPVIKKEELKAAEPELVLLSSEPYPFREKHLHEFRKLLPAGTHVKIVDGEPFTWYGARMLEAPDYFNKLVQSLPY